ncbi:DNA-formamidopyrimidine glycosylase, partial [Alphaproteobacteria bacterium]|nr:DNA-formamidopyrimidine glycosylase [Alphaproteobacteria bacterium]
DKKLTVIYLYKRIQKSEVLIKQILLNQDILAGIGNIYASEILFDAKISPLTKGRDLDKYQIGTIIKSTKKILKKAIESGGSSISDYVSPEGILGNFQNNFKVYGKEGLMVNGFEIKKVILYGRSTFFCPKIQK